MRRRAALRRAGHAWSRNGNVRWGRSYRLIEILQTHRASELRQAESQSLKVVALGDRTLVEAETRQSAITALLQVEITNMQVGPQTGKQTIAGLRHRILVTATGTYNRAASSCRNISLK